MVVVSSIGITDNLVLVVVVVGTGSGVGKMIGGGVADVWRGSLSTGAGRKGSTLGRLLVVGRGIMVSSSWGKRGVGLRVRVMVIVSEVRSMVAVLVMAVVRGVVSVWMGASPVWVTVSMPVEIVMVAVLVMDCAGDSVGVVSTSVSVTVPTPEETVMVAVAVNVSAGVLEAGAVVAGGVEGASLGRLGIISAGTIPKVSCARSGSTHPMMTPLTVLFRGMAKQAVPEGHSR